MLKNERVTAGALGIITVVHGTFFRHIWSIVVRLEVWPLQSQPLWLAFMWPGINIVPASSAFSPALNDPCGFILNGEKRGCQKPQRPQLGLLSVG